MATNSVENILKGAKDTLAKANRFTQTVEGNPTSQFAPKEEPKHISGVPSYKQAHEARKAAGNLPGGNDAEATGKELKQALDSREELKKELNQ